MFSQDRLAHFCHLFLDALEKEGAVDKKEHGNILKKLKNSLDKNHRRLAAAVARAEEKVHQTKKNLVPGSAEYMAQMERVFFDEIHHE